MFIKFTAMSVKCDRCRKYCDDSMGLEHWFRSRRDAIEAVTDDGWAEIDGNLYCPDCYEYNTDTDEYKVKK